MRGDKLDGEASVEVSKLAVVQRSKKQKQRKELGVD